jgi:hypothetical protein
MIQEVRSSEGAPMVFLCFTMLHSRLLNINRLKQIHDPLVLALYNSPQRQIQERYTSASMPVGVKQSTQPGSTVESDMFYFNSLPKTTTIIAMDSDMPPPGCSRLIYRQQKQMRGE